MGNDCGTLEGQTSTTICELKDDVQTWRRVDPSAGGCKNIWPFDKSWYDLADTQSHQERGSLNRKSRS